MGLMKTAIAVAITGGSAVLDFADSAGYPLDDDGTIAAAFMKAHAPATAPLYHIVEYTYTDAATGDAALALAAGATTTAAITVGAGVTLAFEAVFHSAPQSFDSVELFCYELSSGGVPTGNTWRAGIADVDGSTPVYSGAGTTVTARVAPVAGFRVALVFDGDTGEVSGLSTAGALAASATSFTPGNKIAAALSFNDAGVPVNLGNVVTAQLVPNAADMGLAYASGTTDQDGQVCPTA